MSADLIIRYRHDQNTEKEHVCTGKMFYRYEDGSLPPHGSWEFEKEPFKKLLIEASNRLNRCVSSPTSSIQIEKIIIERTDRQGLRPIVMDHPTQEILRVDPVLAIRLLSYEGSAVMTGEKKSEPPPPLRSGYDSVAESLGERVYVRQYKSMVECPGCGMWSTANNPFTCKKKCRIALLPVFYTEQWAQFSVSNLLDLNLPRYYLPRDFNKNKPWISREDLLTLYETWKQIVTQSKENKS